MTIASYIRSYSVSLCHAQTPDYKACTLRNDVTNILSPKDRFYFMICRVTVIFHSDVHHGGPF